MPVIPGAAEHLWRVALVGVLVQCALLGAWWQAEPRQAAFRVAAPPDPQGPEPLPAGADGARAVAERPVKRAPTAEELARDRVNGLRQAFVGEVSGHSLAPDYRRHVRGDLRRRLLGEGVRLRRSQWLVYVDRSPRRQRLVLWYYDRPADRFWAVGAAPVSTGAPFRGRESADEDPHFLTPTGVFRDKPRHGDYLARNVPGRVFDFGRVRSATWRPELGGGELQQQPIQFQAHVGDEVGRAASHGCIRMDPDLNRFLHRRGVWDRLLEGHWKWALVHGEQPAEPPELAGQYLVVGDSCLGFEACGPRYRGLMARLGQRPVGGVPVMPPAGPTAIARR